MALTLKVRVAGKHYEVDYATSTQTKRYYAEGKLVATRAGTTLTYVQSDHLGSSSTLTGTDRKVVARERYSAFGERRRGEDARALLTDQLYTGQRLNVLSNLYHYSDGASAGRFYDPLLARFLSPDKATPPGSQGLNAYSYTLNNPIRHSDPNGQFPWDVTIDVASWIMSANDFRNEPSWANAGWLALDTISLLPAIPAVGAVHHGAKLFGHVDDAVQMAGHLGDAAHATLEVATRAEKLTEEIDIAHQLIREAKSEDKVVVLGRTMEPRVNEVTRRLGSVETFSAPQGLKDEQLWEANRVWLQGKIEAGYVIVNIGPDLGRPPLRAGQIDFYQREMNFLTEVNYKKMIDLDVPWTGPAFDTFWEYFRAR